MQLRSVFNAKTMGLVLGGGAFISMLFADFLTSECAIIVTDDNGKVVFNDDLANGERFVTRRLCPWKSLAYKQLT